MIPFPSPHADTWLALIEVLRAHRDVMRFQTITTYDEAEAFLYERGSHERMPVLLALCWQLERPVFLRLLGHFWSVCDYIGLHLDDLQCVLPETPCREMMTDDEWNALLALPARRRIRIFRGCDVGVNEDGVSWSLDRTVAATFPFKWRYIAKNPVLLTATVRRADIAAYKLCRAEAEVITLFARVEKVEPLHPPPGAIVAPFNIHPGGGDA